MQIQYALTLSSRCFLATHVSFCKRLPGNSHPSPYTHTQMPLWFEEDSHQGQTVAGSIGVAQSRIVRAQRLTPPVFGLVAVALSRFGRACGCSRAAGGAHGAQGRGDVFGLGGRRHAAGERRQRHGPRRLGPGGGARRVPAAGPQGRRHRGPPSQGLPRGQRGPWIPGVFCCRRAGRWSTYPTSRRMALTSRQRQLT